MRNFASVHAPDVNRDHACRKIVKFNGIEACGLHHLLQRLLVWMNANGFGQVAIDLLVVGDQLAQSGLTLKLYQSYTGASRPRN
jgi:hypothetical protein